MLFRSRPGKIMLVLIGKDQWDGRKEIIIDAPPALPTAEGSLPTTPTSLVSEKPNV